MRALIYDIEIIKAIPSKNGERITGIEYCEGWKDHANMGISVIGAMTWPEGRKNIMRALAKRYGVSLTAIEVAVGKR